MEIYGLVKSSLIDYPGKICAIVFTGGCNFRCNFCYSGELVLQEKIKIQPKISQEYFDNFLEEHRNLIDGIVICGGEPTLHKDLPDFIEKIKKYGYLVKLDTNGSNPEMLQYLIKKKLIDYVAMDIKGPKEKYGKICGINIDISNIERSVDILKESNINFEFRTTITPRDLDKSDFPAIADWIGGDNVNYFLQNFSNKKETIDSSLLEEIPYSSNYIQNICSEISSRFKNCRFRA
ncbi:MAG TPA: anaerobic ribonucleoside-triphosphate reductase activating protein [Candidatus Pacearchaeota archaeon]|nr:anaerobic ribonucleoside-triphosphate reductase activating protein [Candidatus Pacearchaeota archaeon]